MNELALKAGVTALVAVAAITKAAFSVTKATTVYKTKKLVALKETLGEAK